MTTYELIKGIPQHDRERLISAGIIPAQWARYMLIYEHVTTSIQSGMNKMDAYSLAGEKYYTSEENVRRIVARMVKPAHC